MNGGQERVQAVAAALEGRLDDDEDPEEERMCGCRLYKVVLLAMRCVGRAGTRRSGGACLRHAWKHKSIVCHVEPRPEEEGEKTAPKVLLLGKDAQELRVVQACHDRQPLPSPGLCRCRMEGNGLDADG